MEKMDTNFKYFLRENIIDSKLYKLIINKFNNIYHFIKDMGIIHNDIKPENIVLNYNNIINTLSIIDYGCITYIPINSLIYQEPTCLTPIYASPELFSCISFSEENYENKQSGIIPKVTSKSDIWSFGMIIYEMYTKKKFFENTEPKCYADYIKRVEEWKLSGRNEVGKEIYEYLNNLIKINPDERNFYLI